MICFINYSIGPYHAARFKALQARLSEKVLFVELASRDTIYPWGNQADQIQAVTLYPGEEFGKIPPAEMVKTILQLLERIKPDVVLTVSYASAAMRAAAIWTRKNNAVSICVTETWKGDKPRFLFWEIAKGMWCRFAYDALFMGGTLSKAYYQGLGLPGSRIWLGQNCVDNDYFANNSIKVRKRKEYYREKYKLPAKYFLCVARLSPEKNLERLIRAFCKYKSKGGNWDLVIVGSGPMDQTLKDLAAKAEISKNVFFMGWKQLDELPIYYALASCFILPSVSEPWGLVVNEAMASSLPVLVSNKCGCIPELCHRGVNGFDFNPYNETEIADVMLKMSSEECDRFSMAQASWDLVRNYSPENYAASLSDCIVSLQKFK